MNVLVTGSNGFVGQALCAHLAGQQHHIWAQARQAQPLSIDEQLAQYLRALEADFASISAEKMQLSKIQAVVHCAARVHQMRETSADPLAQYREINTQQTLALAGQAARAGVRRFVFLSSVKVNGGFTERGRPFRASQAAAVDAYGLSKWEAERGLLAIAAKTSMEVVIIRPPLVYGPGVKANFLTMMRVLHRGIPLPFGAIRNQRSLIALPNLVDFIALCLTHPKAAHQTFMISDQKNVSTPELLRSLASALHRPARLLPLPEGLLRLSLNAIGKSSIAQRLCSDLTVDSSPATDLLGWKPPLTVQQGLQLAADHFLAAQATRRP